MNSIAMQPHTFRFPRLVHSAIVATADHTAHLSFLSQETRRHSIYIESELIIHIDSYSRPREMPLPNRQIPGFGDERSVAASWERFVQNIPFPTDSVRNVVLNSWQRCRSEAVDPTSRHAPAITDSTRVAHIIERHHYLFEAAQPILKIFQDILRESGGGIVLLTDSTGIILDVAGESHTRNAAERINLMPGGCWREEDIGTNAIGTAIVSRQPVQIHASEHYCLDIKGWTCAAAPILDPFDQTLLGVLDISDFKGAFHGQTLGMAIAAAKQIESALARHKLEQSMANQVQREKLASLGRLVAGVAHNLNTPLGVTLTTASLLKDSINDLSRQVELGQLRKQSLLNFITQCQEAASLLEKNTLRAASLIGDFKQMAIDRTRLSRCVFELPRTLDDALPAIKKGLESCLHELSIFIEPGIVLDSFPEAIIQLFASLITLSLEQNASQPEPLVIRIEVKQASEDRVAISYRDEGIGLADTLPNHVFDPFFNTQLGDAAHGFGLYTVYHLVTAVLGGSIEVPSHAGKGMQVEVLLPREAPSS